MILSKLGGARSRLLGGSIEREREEMRSRLDWREANPITQSSIC